jgi:hypothetical protein
VGRASRPLPDDLADWIVEKFRTWRATGGDIESAFRRNDLHIRAFFFAGRS